MASRKDEKILNEAQTRLNTAVSFESEAWSRWLDDVKFANADPDNGYQWPRDVMQNRQIEQRPCLTINKTRQHCLQITNDARQNKPMIKVIPVANGASVEAAAVFNDVIRRIEYNSNAQSAYDMATKFQVQGGIGFLRVRTDYCDDDSFDQEIFIDPVPNPMMIRIDPEAKQPDKSDMKWCFVFEDMPREEFEKAYPKFKDMSSNGTLAAQNQWVTPNSVRIAEYYRIKETAVRLVAYTAPETGEVTLVRTDDPEFTVLPPEIREALLADETTKARKVYDRKVEWFKIVGNEIVDRTVIPGKYIPIVPVIGEETVIEGKLDRKGHVRSMKDAQRMYNYHASASVEFAAMQTKTPWVGPMAAFEGLEDSWKRANTQNFAYLGYNHKDDDGQPIEPPSRIEPPTASPAYLQGMEIASNEMQSVSGQFEANFGEQGNERSGKAINERQRAGDRATYHYIDNLAVAIRHLGKILINMIPIVYDTKRVVQTMGEDGTEATVQIDPEAKAAYEAREEEREAEAAIIFNPSVGKYDVMADVAPAYATRRQETFNAISQIITSSPETMALVGDILFKVADFPQAEELAERFRRMVPSQALGEGPTPEVQALQQQVTQMQSALEASMQALADKSREYELEGIQKQIDVFKAETDRIAKLVEKMSPEALAPIIAQTLVQALNGPNLPNEPPPAMPIGEQFDPMQQPVQM